MIIPNHLSLLRLDGLTAAEQAQLMAVGEDDADLEGLDEEEKRKIIRSSLLTPSPPPSCLLSFPDRTRSDRRPRRTITTYSFYYRFTPLTPHPSNRPLPGKKETG